ncbi:MAG TPA: FliA/WhiG family RNA polymerase sigma factor [Armatimonadota bacterium]|nr:FliA/WhiG family RNA polymerase sigma factor [Armatimonadota bacterium]
MRAQPSGQSYQRPVGSGSAQLEGLPGLWFRFKHQGDAKARETLIDNYCYLVKITVSRVAGSIPPSMEREDLIGAGLVGLIRAVDQFDSSREVKFETYAIALIRGAVLELLRGADFAPRSVRDKIKMLEQAYASVERQLGRPGTDEEVAAALETSVDGLYTLLSSVSQASVLSLDEMLFSSEPDATLRVGDTVVDPRASESLSGEIEQRERRQALATAVQRLPEREQLVLSLYYYEGLTFKEIGKLLTVSESRAYQLQQQALVRLRGYLRVDHDLFTD